MAPRTIVVPLDGSDYSERALAIATSVADRVGADLVLVTAAIGGPLQPRDYLEEKASGLRVGAGRVDVKVSDGEPIAAIVHATKEADDAVVCMTTHGRGRVRWAALGSVAEEVLQRVEGPVILVGRNCRPDCFVRPTRLLVCVDGIGTAKALAPAVDEWAAALSVRTELTIVVHPLDVASAEHGRDTLDELTAPFGTVESATMLTNRFAAGAIADFADAMPATMIAMSAHARGGLSRVALGSVTMGVVHLASCPVLAFHNAAPDDQVVTGAGG
jgi:nucleotide-binding universal stress UspA family protein